MTHELWSDEMNLCLRIFFFRICAGRNLAEASIWIAVASMLAMFNIRPAIDARSGEPIDVRGSLRGTPGLFK